jgi:hypothetical protein
MLLPSVEQYSIAIEQKDWATFSYLHDYTFLPTGDGDVLNYCYYKGTSAAIYKATRGSGVFAIRCFLKSEKETFQRYGELADYLGARDLPWKVEFEFLDQEIYIGDQRYPVVKMDWMDAMPLNKYIEEIAYDPAQLTSLQQKLMDLSRNLESNGLGHGDLNFRHIQIDRSKDDRIILFDYDTMFMPGFKGKLNLGTGSPGFQHPRRLSIHFNETIDRFSIWLMITAIEALKWDAGLWKQQQNSPNRDKSLLFSLRDLVNPAQSKLFQKLKSSGQPALTYYIDQVSRFCLTGNPGRIDQPELFQEKVVSSTTSIKPLTAEPKNADGEKPSPPEVKEAREEEKEITKLPDTKIVSGKDPDPLQKRDEVVKDKPISGSTAAADPVVKIVPVEPEIRIIKEPPPPEPAPAPEQKVEKIIPVDPVIHTRHPAQETDNAEEVPDPVAPTLALQASNEPPIEEPPLVEPPEILPPEPPEVKPKTPPQTTKETILNRNNDLPPNTKVEPKHEQRPEHKKSWINGQKKHDHSRFKVKQDPNRSTSIPQKEHSKPEAKKEKEPIAVQSKEPEDEIIEFKADKDQIKKDEFIILSWKVKGKGRIHISGVGNIDERIGRKVVFLKRSTEYVLTAGTQQQSLTVEVEGDPVKPTRKAREPVQASSASSTRPLKINKKLVTLVMAGVALVLLGILAANYIMNRDDTVASTNNNTTAPEVKKNISLERETFSPAAISVFLNGLYRTYNNRDLDGIMKHYAPRLTEYYDSGSIGRDSLSGIIRDLFISPVFYECHPDMKTLSIQPGKDFCTVVVTINEKLKSNHTSRIETYATTIEYVVDTSFRIISERNPG